MPAVNDVGEPGAGEPHARFDGRELETGRLVRVTEVGQPDGKPRAPRLPDLPPNDRHRASSRPYGRIIWRSRLGEGPVGDDLEARMSVLGPHVFDGVPLVRSAAAAEVPLRTAQRWLAAYAADGATGLARAPRSDRAKRRRIPAELVALIEGWALRRPPPRVTEVHREAVRVAMERGWPAPSYPVVRRIITGLDRGLLALAHGGVSAYRDDFELVLRR